MSSPNSKRKDQRPARVRYWAGKHLEHNKVRHMIRSCQGLTAVVAAQLWRMMRGNRRMKSSSLTKSVLLEE